MHVLHLYKDYPPVLGGIEGHVRLVAEGQAERGRRVTVLVTALDARTTTAEENGVEVVRAARLATLASAPLSLALARELRRRRPDLTHLHLPYPPGEAAHTLFGHGATVVTYHADVVRQRWLGRLYSPFLRRLLARADAVLATNPRVRESSPVLRRLGERCRVVPLGIDVERFAAARPPAREDGRGVILFVGRLRYYKGLDTLIAAAERIEAEIRIVGRGPMEEAWRRQAAASPAAARIRFLGDLPDAELPACYAAADVFVLPSNRRSEAFGLALVEAMASGKPVVSTELGTGTSWVNVDGETGLVVAPDDPAALAAAVERLLADGELRRRFGEAARRRAVAEFSRERLLDRLEAVYREVLDARAGP